MTGEWPENDIDHKNQDALDDRFCNLRIATRSQNLANKPTRNPSGVKGVYINHGKLRTTYSVLITHNKRQLNFGTYRTIEEAAAIVHSWNKARFGEFACD